MLHLDRRTQTQVGAGPFHAAGKGHDRGAARAESSVASDSARAVHNDTGVIEVEEQSGVAGDVTDEAIQRRAYEISQQEDAGTAEENWERAARELRGDQIDESANE